MKKTKKSVISSLFNLDSKWLRCSATVFDYMCLNVLFCLTCLPFLTIGVAKMSLYATLVNDHSGQSEHLLADYVSFFKRYLQRGLLLGNLETALIGVILLDLYLVWHQTALVFQVFKVLCLASLFLLLMVSCYLYPLATKSQEPVIKLLKKSFILLSLHFPWSFAFLASLGIMMFILKQSLLVFLVGLSLFLIIGISGMTYLYMCVMERILK
ncbi:DUF624 domain-containing protein [Streptococcus iniae]|uniref:DUF624 domain-containing protein n=1 Tax=Streptococcus iniae TaxID=1346 RepID=UPI0008D9B9B2|nr:DUF624 domain-containing protein [Streptococcus iniae]OHX28407.1 hypothetical protein BKX95_00690 [Streptococcus iniae]RLV27060.1 DUF624 domain-containing protein [Streptococcus iniae]